MEKKEKLFTELHATTPAGNKDARDVVVVNSDVRWGREKLGMFLGGFLD
ncbi:hypothetical protein H8E77_22380 [bacterium]|nr:hypothetical protein [bacterium]